MTVTKVEKVPDVRAVVAAIKRERQTRGRSLRSVAVIDAEAETDELLRALEARETAELKAVAEVVVAWRARGGSRESREQKFNAACLALAEVFAGRGSSAPAGEERAVPCCEFDTNGDGDCPRHPRGRVRVGTGRLRHVGLHPERRFHSGPQAPRERALAELWEKENSEDSWTGVWLDELMCVVDPTAPPNPAGPPVRQVHEITQRDAEIVATVIQWLGTNVGFGFLEMALKEAGYRITPGHAVIPEGERWCESFIRWKGRGVAHTCGKSPEFRYPLSEGGYGYLCAGCAEKHEGYKERLERGCWVGAPSRREAASESAEVAK